MKADYDAFVERMIQQYEGGYGWDAGDPGGPTKYGITCYDLAEHRGETMNSMTAWAPLVRAMQLPEAEAIYASKYATAVQFDALNAGPDCAVFDFNVNSGSWGIKFAQRVAGVDIDGILGPISLAAINAMNPETFVVNLCAQRLTFLRGLSSMWGEFGLGWTARVNDLRVYCLGLIADAAKPMALMETMAKEPYTMKPVRIPKAFAKSYPPL